MTKNPKHNILRFKQSIQTTHNLLILWQETFLSSYNLIIKFQMIVFQHLFCRPAELHKKALPKTMFVDSFNESHTVHNSSFVYQPQGITIIRRLGENKQTSWMWIHDRKSEPGVREICGQMPKRQLTVQVFGWAQEWFRSFCLVWPGTDHSPAPDTMDHTVGQTERERVSESVWERGVDEVG